jgi:hypothetical protein
MNSELSPCTTKLIKQATQAPLHFHQFSDKQHVNFGLELHGVPAYAVPWAC